MSWLYSLVFAGLLFGSDTAEPINSVPPTAAVPTVEVAASDETEKFEQTYPLSRNGRVRLSNVNGSITVEAWDRDEVRLEATKIADSKESLSDVEIKINSTPDSLDVEAEYKPWKWNDNRTIENKYRKLEVQFRLSVPRTAILNKIETVNGSVNVSNFTNITKISAVNGNVTATNLRGTASLETVNGEVLAEFDRVDATSKINLSTVNGKVNLVLPSDVNATVKADSLNGNITNDFGLPVRKGQYVGRDLYGRIGSGETQIKLSSVNGQLSIGKKNDGRSPAPATNLLPNKKADEDWDSDTSRSVNPVQIDREVARAVREAQRATSESMKRAAKEIESIGPVTESIRLEELGKLEKFKVDEGKIKASIDAGMRAQRDSLQSMRDALWLEGLSTVEKKRGSYGVKGTPKVTVDAKGCSVSVRGWDKNEVQYVVTEVAGRRGQPATVTAEMHDNSVVSLKVVNTIANFPASGFQTDPERVHIQIYVPRKTNLKVTSNGEIRIDGISGDVQLTGDDESINVRDFDGTMSLVADEALVRVIGFKGDLNSQTACGDVFLEGDFKKLSAKATDGTVTLTLPTDANATVTSNTDIESEGVDVVRENERTWRVGKGGIKYNFDFVDGKLVVRSSSSVSTF